MYRTCRSFCRPNVLALAALTLLSGWLVWSSSASAEERRLRIYSVNTEERIDVVYKRDGEYVPEGLDKLDWIMRDWRRDEKIEMSRKLIDLLWEVHQQVGSEEPIQLISGYRSRKTNEMLRRTKGGQASKSQHILGNAVDVHFPDVPVKRLRNAGLIRQYGGVGYYPTSAIPFVHLDVARVRHWPRLPRQELALLFPTGETQHIPADGRALRKDDFKTALAKLEEKGEPLPWATRQQLQQAPRPVLASLGPLTSSFGFSATQTSAEASDAAGVATQPAVSPRPPQRKIISRASVESAPAYDDDHADELYYQPFPLLPMLANTSVAAMDFRHDTPDLLETVHRFFADARSSLLVTFEPGLQYGKLYWASRFSGRAVSRVLSNQRAEAASHQGASPIARR